MRNRNEESQCKNQIYTPAWKEDWRSHEETPGEKKAMKHLTGPNHGVSSSRLTRPRRRIILRLQLLQPKIVITSQEPKGEGNPYVSEEDSDRIRSRYTRSTNVKMQDPPNPSGSNARRNYSSFYENVATKVLAKMDMIQILSQKGMHKTWEYTSIPSSMEDGQNQTNEAWNFDPTWGENLAWKVVGSVISAIEA